MVWKRGHAGLMSCVQAVKPTALSLDYEPVFGERSAQHPCDIFLKQHVHLEQQREAQRCAACRCLEPLSKWRLCKA